MKKKYQCLILFLVITLTTFIYGFYFTEINGDEIWNYGFAYNIYNHLIPYKDFNMIVPPLFAISCLPIFNLLGSNLISFHLHSAIIVALTIMIMYKKVGLSSLIIYVFIIIDYIPSYNLFSLFLFSILLLINDISTKHKDTYLGLLVSLIFLTKQTIGLCLLIPCIYYSKSKIKTLISFIIPILIFVIYLNINNALYNFIDYCFLGMISFTNKNKNLSIYSILTIVSIIFILYKLIKSKFKKSHFFYSLMFQIIAFPLGDSHHFLLATSTIIYAILIENKLSKKILSYLLVYLYSILTLITILNYYNHGFKLNIYTNDNLYQGRNINPNIINFEKNYKETLNYIKEIDYEKLFVFSKNSYYLKLSQNQTITKFDLINNGNMGYKAHQGYIQEIATTCQKEKCLFIVEIYDNPKNMGQTNLDIIKYVQKNYENIGQIGQFKIYKTIN